PAVRHSFSSAPPGGGGAFGPRGFLAALTGPPSCDALVCRPGCPCRSVPILSRAGPTSAEPRRPTRDEGLIGLLVVGVLHADRLRLRFERQRALDVHGELPVDQRLRHLD